MKLNIMLSREHQECFYRRVHLTRGSNQGITLASGLFTILGLSDYSPRCSHFWNGRGNEGEYKVPYGIIGENDDPSGQDTLNIVDYRGYLSDGSGVENVVADETEIL